MRHKGEMKEWMVYAGGVIVRLRMIFHMAQLPELGAPAGIVGKPQPLAHHIQLPPCVTQRRHGTEGRPDIELRSHWSHVHVTEHLRLQCVMGHWTMTDRSR
jgi:hypothetical protein